MRTAHLCAKCVHMLDGRTEVVGYGVFSAPACAITVEEFRGFYADVMEWSGDTFDEARTNLLEAVKTMHPVVAEHLARFGEV